MQQEWEGGWGWQPRRNRAEQKYKEVGTVKLGVGSQEWRLQGAGMGGWMVVTTQEKQGGAKIQRGKSHQVGGEESGVKVAGGRNGGWMRGGGGGNPGETWQNKNTERQEPSS